MESVTKIVSVSELKINWNNKKYNIGFDNIQSLDLNFIIYFLYYSVLCINYLNTVQIILILKNIS